MNSWIILLFLLMCGCNTGCHEGPCPAQGRGEDRGGEGRGGGRERGRGRGRDNECGCDSGFEPRFDATPFGGGRETCGCEETDD